MRPPLALLVLLGDSASYGGALLRHYIYLPVYEVPMSMGLAKPTPLRAMCRLKLLYIAILLVGQSKGPERVSDILAHE